MVLPSQTYFLESQHSLIQEEGRHKNMADTKKKTTLRLDMSECHGGIESSLEFLPSIHFTDLVEMCELQNPHRFFTAERGRVP